MVLELVSWFWSHAQSVLLLTDGAEETVNLLSDCHGQQNSRTSVPSGSIRGTARNGNLLRSFSASPRESEHSEASIACA